ncbi:MAG: glycosyltransferase [Phycisphaerae bacterium]
MRVLHVLQSLDPAWGGIARVVPELAAGLATLGVSGSIATLAGGRYGQPPRGLPVETHVRRLRRAAPGGRERSPAPIGPLVADCDVLHLHGLWTAQNYHAARAARAAGRPYVVTPHSMMMPWAWRRSAWKKRPIGWLFEHRNLRRAARLLALAPGEGDAMRTLGFNPRIDTIPNGVWPADYANLPPPDALLQRFPHLADARWMLFASRIAVQKGIVPLLQAAFELATSHDAWHLVVAGPDSAGLQSVLAAAAERKGLGRRVTFVGMLDRPQLRSALGRAELFVQPSLSEGLSISILEALAAGRPVLISPACNLPEVAEFGAGRVVEPRRRAIAAALHELVALGPAEWSAMGAAARRLIAERFDWRILLPRYVEMYAAVCAGR